MRFRNRFFDRPSGSFFLFGPRGTGKSTWCVHSLDDSSSVDLLQPEVLRSYLARPERLRELVHQSPEQQCFVVDEVQKAPQLLDVVHGLIEEHRGWNFVLTGSSARKLRRAGVDLMAGRAAWREMHPYMAGELGSDFSLSQALDLGCLPVVLESKSPSDTLSSYIGLYLREEVMQEGLVRNLSDFSRFLEVASLSHGQVLNISNIARECHVERSTVAGFISVLEDLLLAFRLPVFDRRAKRAVVNHPKFYYFDAGIFRSLRPTGPLDQPSKIDGAGLEGLVAQHLRAWIAYSRPPARLYYWRTKGGAEIDFVVYGEAGFWAIEVKNARDVHARDLRSLKTFGGDYPEATCILLHRGEADLLIDGIPCIPCEPFLKAMTPSEPLPTRLL